MRMLRDQFDSQVPDDFDRVVRSETKPTIEAFAAVEGLDGHGRAATIRFKSNV